MRVFLSKAQKVKYYRNLRIKIYFFAGLLLVIGAAVVYGITNAPFLKIQKFEVVGNVKLEEAQAEVLTGNLARFLGFNNFLSWPSKLGDIKIEKNFSDGVLRLVGNETRKFAIWCDKECSWVDARGRILETAPDTEGSSIPKIKDSRDLTLISGNTVLEENLFGNIVKIIDGLQQLPTRIGSFEFNDRLQELRASGTKGERLIFSVRFTPPPKAFNYLRDLALSGELRGAEYVDLTVENRVYLKPR